MQNFMRPGTTNGKKWKTSPFNSRIFEHDMGPLGAYTLQAYWLLSVLERAKSTDPEKIIKIWEGEQHTRCQRQSAQDEGLRSQGNPKLDRQ